MSIAYNSKIVVSRYEHLQGRLVCYSYDPSSSTWSLAYYYIRRMVSMIEPTKGPPLLSNLSALQVSPVLDNCEV